MRLFVANPTRQRQVLFYRPFIEPPGAVRSFRPASQIEIQPGKQVPIPHDFASTEAADVVVGQISKHGAVAEKEVKGCKRYIRYVWNVGQPVGLSALRTAVALNKGIKTEEGKDRRMRAAVGVSETVQRVVAEQFAEVGQGEVAPTDKIDVGIEQLETTEENQVRTDESFRVRPDPAGGPRGRAKGRAKNR